MQMKTPKFQLAHRGSIEKVSHLNLIDMINCTQEDVRLFRLQSAHVLLASNFRRLLMVC